MISIEQLVQLAQEVEATDPIDWGMLSVDETTTYRLMATQIVELFGAPTTQRELLLTASLLKLVVHNFVLNMNLLGGQSGE